MAMKALRALVCGLVLFVVSLATHCAQATDRYFDTNGAGTAGAGITTGTTYSWESPFWNIADSAGSSATSAWTESDFPRFSAGTTVNNSVVYTVNAGASHTIAGMFGQANNGSIHVTTSGGAVLTQIAGLQGYFVGTNTSLFIDTPLAGANATSQLRWAGSGGSLFLYANNSNLLGGVQLDAANGLNFNNANSFGPSGTSIKFGNTASTYVIANPDTVAPLTIANPLDFSSRPTAANMTLIYTGHDAVTFSSPTTLSPGFTTSLTVANTAFPTAKLILAGGVSGTATSALTANNNAVNVFGTLVLTGASTYGGTTTIGNSATNGVIALQATQGVGLPTNFLNLNGGVYQGNNAATNFTRSLGTSGANKFQWNTNGGGFSANGGQMTVNIGGAGAGLVWGATVGSQIVGNLDFGSGSANDKTVFQNPIDLNNTATTGLTRTIQVVAGTGGDSAEISGAISNSGAAAALSKTGTGTLVLSSANTYSNGTTIIAGSIGIGNNTALGGGGLTLGGTSAVSPTIFASGGNRTIGNNVTLAAVTTGSATVGAGGDLVINGTVTNSGSDRTLTVNNGTTTLGGSVFLSENDTNSRTLTLNGSGAVIINGLIKNNSGANSLGSKLTYNSTTGGTLTVNNANTYTGATTLSAGNVIVGNKQAFGTGAAAIVAMNGVTMSANTDLSGVNAIPNDATLGGNNTFTGSNNMEFSGTVAGTANRTVTNSMSGAVLTLSGPVNIRNTGTTTTTLTFNGSGDTLVSGALSNGSATIGNLTKNGAGTLTLTNASNNYTGTTTVSGGTLLVNGSITGTGPVTVTGATLGGSGSIAGPVTVNGNGTLSPGTSPESLGTGTLTFTATATNASHLKFDIGPGTQGDLVNAAGGSLNIADSTVAGTAAGTMLDLVGSGYIPTGNKYTVVVYDGKVDGSGWNGNKFKNDINGYVYMIGANPRQFLIKYNDVNFGGNISGESQAAKNANANTRFVTLVAVPELGSFLTMGLVGCFAWGAVRLGKRFGYRALCV